MAVLEFPPVRMRGVSGFLVCMVGGGGNWEAIALGKLRQGQWDGYSL